jgi:Pyridoxamine 5'-phosphate oxidase
MATLDPDAKNLADLYHLPLLEWADVQADLESNPTQGPGTGGPDHHTFWLSTVDADGRSHLTALGAMWLSDHYYFCGSPRSRKIRNVERDPRCALGVATNRYDVSIEGRAVRVTDEVLLQRVAELFAKGGWTPTVGEGGFTNDFSAPSAGPPPWYVYEFSFERAYALATKEPGGATRWTF